VVKAFNEAGRKLVVIGDDEISASLLKQVCENITFMGRQLFNVVRDYFVRCNAA